MSLITPTLINILRQRFNLDWQGIHGCPHWARVRQNGLLLAPLTGANSRVIEYFAFLHDVCRDNDDHDPWHGIRAAEFVKTLYNVIELSTSEFEDLTTACAFHNDGYTTGYNTTILTCWDADRLDLGRVFIRPNPRHLCTNAARDPEMLARAYCNGQVKQDTFLGSLS
jgi:uncharacterized protein